ncbi:MAG: D-alanyl-D-alanine carboxypeptidase [Thermodesulfobacteriota bacterium]
MSGKMRHTPHLLIFFFCTFFSIDPSPALSSGKFPYEMLGDQDALLVVDPNGKIILSKNSDDPLIPASTLKILTSLVALHYLGEAHRFVTEFYLDREKNLKIKGYGDPFLVSEVISGIASELSTRISTVNSILLDDGFFSKPIEIPGVFPSFEPYDAPNGALCANFNTVNFKKEKDGYVSAEPQTPLLPFVKNRIARSDLKEGRILLSNRQDEMTLYFGHLLRYFLNEKGVKTGHRIGPGRIDESKDRMIFRFISPFSLHDVISELLKYSNNFVANQLFITVGARVYGPPGNIEKGIRASQEFIKHELNTEKIVVAEGSGISRKNRISAKDMSRVLARFKPHRLLMTTKNGESFKTGTLGGVSALAGYGEDPHSSLYTFVILLNTPGNRADAVMKKIRAFLR